MHLQAKFLCQFILAKEQRNAPKITKLALRERFAQTMVNASQFVIFLLRKPTTVKY